MESRFKQDPMLWFEAEKRKAALERGYPVADDKGGSRFVEPPKVSPLMDILSRFLHPGSQTAPASPKYNQEGVEDEVIQK